jgi:pyrroloquinoline quinone biosynthesis protein D
MTEPLSPSPAVSVSAKLHEKPSLAPKARIRFDVRSATHFLLYPERALELGGSAPDLVLRCKGDRTLEEVIRDVAAEQGTSFAEAAAEALPFFAELERRGLLVWR